MSIAAAALEEHGLEGLLDHPVEGFDPNGAVLTTSSIKPILTFPEAAHWPMQPILLHHRGPYVVLGHCGRGLHGRVTKNYNLKRKEYVAHKYDAPLPLGVQLRQKRGETGDDVLDADIGKTTPLENVLPRHELIDADGNRFIEMPWIETFLSDIYEPAGVRKHLGNGIGKRELYSHIGQIINGLAGMHGVWNIAHRDLKLSNIGVTPDKQIPDGKVWLSDFGLSSSGHTISPRDNLGWIYLRPPENFMSKVSADERYDMWSLGALIYRMCTGKYPLEDELDALAKRDHVNDMNDSASIKAFMKERSARWANSMLPFACGDELLQKKIHKRSRLGMNVIPSEVRGLLDQLLRWDHSARCSDGVEAQKLWNEMGRSSRQWRRGVGVVAALSTLAVAGTAAYSQWPRAIITPEQLENAKKYEENAHIYNTAPPLIMDVGKSELFRRMLKQSYDIAVLEVLKDRTVMRDRDEPPINEAFTAAQREEYDRRYAKMEAEQEVRMREDPIQYKYTSKYWATKYQRMRNYFINEAFNCGYMGLYGKNQFDPKNRKAFMACALIGGWTAADLSNKYGKEQLIEILDKEPEKVLTERDAKLLGEWSKAFDRANPINQWHPGYSPDPRFR